MRVRAAGGGATGGARRIDRALAWFAGAVLLLGGAGVALGAVWLRGAGQVSGAEVAIAVAGIRAEVPGGWVRARSGEGVALVVAPAELGMAAPDGPVLVHLAPADDAPDPADRPTLLYARFLSPEASTGAGGLVRREFRAGTPFEGEALYVAPPDGRGFSARCAAAAAPGQAECAAAFRLRGAEVRLGLPAALLPHGPDLVRRLAQRLGGA